MNQRALMVAGLLFLVIVASMFAYAYKKRTETQTTIPIPAPPQRGDAQNIERVDVKG